MKPILARSEITDAVYIVTKYKIFKDGLVRTIEKYDVTDQFDAMTEPLRAENAKLRELAAWMYRLMDESCAVQHPYAPEPIRYDTLLDVHEKLCELGVEVDG